MNYGFSNLATLRQHLLAGAAAMPNSAITPDAVFAAIGLGMAGLMDTFCNRSFAYADGAQEIFTGDRDHYYVRRYPFVAVASVETRYTAAEAWADIGQPISTNPQSGLLHFGYTLGLPQLQARVTYTGGYWFDTKEPADPGYPSAKPDGVAPLPEDVRLAWLLQCQEVWNKKDKVGLGLATTPDTFVAVGKLDLIPLVKQMLKAHIRYQLL